MKYFYVEAISLRRSRVQNNFPNLPTTVLHNERNELMAFQKEAALHDKRKTRNISKIKKLYPIKRKNWGGYIVASQTEMIFEQLPLAQLSQSYGVLYEEN